MEDQDGSRAHQLTKPLDIVKEVALGSLRVANIDSTLDVPSLVLVVEAAVNNDARVLIFRPKKVGKRRCLNRITRGIESVIVVH